MLQIRKAMKKPRQKSRVIVHNLRVYPYREQEGLIVGELRWKNLKGRIASVPLPSQSLQNLCHMFIGIACSAFFALLGFKAAQIVPDYVWIISWVVMFTASGLAYGFHHLSKHQKESSTQSITDILESMSLIEQEFDIPAVQKPEALPSLVDAVEDQARPGRGQVLVEIGKKPVNR